MIFVLLFFHFLRLFYIDYFFYHKNDCFVIKKLLKNIK